MPQAKTKKVADSKPVGRPVGQAAPNVHPLRGNVGDTLVNLVTGMGTGKDKQTATQFIFNAMDRQQVEAAYRGDWISRKIIDIPATDATREWRTWQADKGDITKLTDLEANLNIQRKTKSVLQKSRLYGGAALVMGIDQGQPDEPVEVEKLGLGCLKFVHVVNRYEISAGTTDWDIMSPWFGQPSYYERQVQGSLPVRLHPSRVVRFLGAEIPDITQAQGWGDSVLQIVSDAVISMNTVSQSIASLIQEAKVDIVKIPELSERISSQGYEDRLKTRFAMAALMKSIYSVLLVDKEEDWERVEQTFQGMPDILREFMTLLCGAADIPATRFLGEPPKGLNATGESDTRNYYDRVSTEQHVEVQPVLEPLDTVLQISALGKAPDGLFYEWNPLWQLSATEKATIAKSQADVLQIDVNTALMDPMVLQKARENQLIESGLYPGLEQIIDEFGTDIDEREPAPGVTPPPAMIDPQTGKPPDPNDPAAVARAIPDPNAPPAAVPATSASANAPAKPVAGKKVAGTDEAIEAMASRIRDAQLVDESTPRTLYIYRPVLNWREIAKFYKDQGVNNVYGSDMHVTICYSKTPVDWLKVGEDTWGNDDKGNLTVKPGGARVMEQFNKFLVLAFANSDLSWRHCSVIDRTGGSWDYEDYTPHVSISKDPGAVDPLTMKAWTGAINLGPEVFEEIKVDGAQYNAPAELATSGYDAAPVIPAPVVNVTLQLDAKGRVKKKVNYGLDGRPESIDTIEETRSVRKKINYGSDGRPESIEEIPQE